jgi:hypothetical protein
VVFENGKRQPMGDDLEAEITSTEGLAIAVVDDPFDKIGDGYIYRYPSNR